MTLPAVPWHLWRGPLRTKKGCIPNSQKRPPLLGTNRNIPPPYFHNKELNKAAAWRQPLLCLWSRPLFYQLLLLYFLAPAWILSCVNPRTFFPATSGYLGDLRREEIAEINMHHRTNLVASYWLDFPVSRGFEKSNLRFLLKIFSKENLCSKGERNMPFSYF